MATIEGLLHRRTDLSTFLVHLTRVGSDGAPARENLLSILEEGFIQARTPQGVAREYDQEFSETGFTQKVVCLTETPLEHLWMMLSQIDGRQVSFESYGLATTKASARHAGANPVWYSDITPGRDWPFKHLKELVRQAVDRATVNGKLVGSKLIDEPIMQIAPYFETMGPTSQGRKEFWWEREWRKIGDYNLDAPKRWVAILAPEWDHKQLLTDITALKLHPSWQKRPILDPEWGLERMIAVLADVDTDYFGPFTKDR